MNGARRDRVDGIKDFNIRQKCLHSIFPPSRRRVLSVFDLGSGPIKSLAEVKIG